MSALGSATAARLVAKGIELNESKVENILFRSGVTSSASRGVPVALRIRRLEVEGTKTYAAVAAEMASSPLTKREPFKLVWAPGDGVNGIGSEANLRGKSSVIQFIQWAMTGRNGLQADVASWVDRLSAELEVDGVKIHVQLTMSEGSPVGTVEQEVSAKRARLGSFSNDAEFESLMGKILLERLRLHAFPVFSNGVETEHSWPSYIGALTVNANQLDPIIGNENTLKTRALQMFVGTSWATADAQVASARKALESRREKLRPTSPSTTVARDEAEARVAAAKSELASLGETAPDMRVVLQLASSATARAEEAHGLALLLMTAQDAAAQAESQLRAEELCRQVEVEDALARRLFNGMVPTVCPRCSSAVTEQRYEAEATDHECSLCHADLGLDDLAAEHDEAIASEAVSGSGLEPMEEDAGTDSLDALRAAAEDAHAAVAGLQAQLRLAEEARAIAETEAERGRESLDQSQQRLTAQLRLARAEGALESIDQSSRGEDQVGETDDELRVLEAAHALTRAWVKSEQDPVLRDVSDEIVSLARQFGATNLVSVDLKGNGNMDVEKGGAGTTYSGLTNGEKLRVKLAAAIALIRIGHRDGVGRHPGLLFIDSPAAEEIPEADLRVMLDALKSVAVDTSMQVFVATTHGSILGKLLPRDHALIASGSDFVW